MRSATDNNSLSESEKREIFLNIGKICALNLDLLRELEMRFNDWQVSTLFHFVYVVTQSGIVFETYRDSNTVIADAIAKRAQFFKVLSFGLLIFDN